MITNELIKEIITSNEDYILNGIKSIIPREELIFPSSQGKVCILYGTRRSGKTYILYDIFRNNKEKALYIDFEDERLSDIKPTDLQKIEESFFELKPHLINQSGLVFLFDKVQNVNGWEKYARRISEKNGVKVFATGSSSKIMPPQIHTSLRGRSWGIEILPFSFSEYLHALNVDIKNNDYFYGPKKAILKNSFFEYLKYGGFPEIAVLTSDYEKKKILKEYIDAMFFKDLVERFNIKNIQLLDVLKEKLFSSFSTRYSLTAFCKQYKDKFPFSKDSVFAYSRYFHEAMLIFETRRLSDSSYQRLRNPAKIYLVDTGLAKSVTSSDYGRLLENLIFLQLKRKENEIYFFEDKGECDFVCKKDGKWSAYQVVWELNENSNQREYAGLISACNHLKLDSGTIITYDYEEKKEIDGITINIVPTWKWLLNT